MYCNALSNAASWCRHPKWNRRIFAVRRAGGRRRKWFGQIFYDLAEAGVAEVSWRRFSEHFLLLGAERAWTAAQPERRREAPERRLRRRPRERSGGQQKMGAETSEANFRHGGRMPNLRRFRQITCAGAPEARVTPKIIRSPWFGQISGKMKVPSSWVGQAETS